MGYEKSMMMGQKPDIPGLYKNSWEVWMFIPLNMAIICFYWDKTGVHHQTPGLRLNIPLTVMTNIAM